MQQRSNAIGLNVRLFVISAIGWLVVSAVGAQSASAHAIAEPVDGWGVDQAPDHGGWVEDGDDWGWGPADYDYYSWHRGW